jgi:hypothetical protein
LSLTAQVRWCDAPKLIIDRVFVVNTALEHTHLSADDAEAMIKKRLRAHIDKILKKILSHDRPVTPLDKPSRALNAIWAEIL